MSVHWHDDEKAWCPCDEKNWPKVSPTFNSTAEAYEWLLSNRPAEATSEDSA